MAKNKCEHEHIQFDKINDYNYCQDCMQVFKEDKATILEEGEYLVDDMEENLKKINNL